MLYLVGSIILGLVLGIMIISLCGIAKTPACSPGTGVPETPRSKLN
jgi:hypothetical protein